jgi:hypothetical protein
MGWFGHPCIIIIIILIGGGSASPLGHGGGRATPWPKGWPATPYGVVRPPLIFFLII